MTASIAMLDGLSYLQRYAWFALPADDAKDSTGPLPQRPHPTPAGSACRLAPGR